MRGLKSFVAIVALAAGICSAQSAWAQGKELSCDESITKNFKPDPLTKVLMVKQIRKGDKLPYDGGLLSMFGVTPPPAEADLCLVKLLVGPGNPGPAGAPSTSRGIGIEIWLPSKEAWNQRIHAVGGGGWAGSEELDLAKISSVIGASDLQPPAMVAAREGSVSSSTDTGHSPRDRGGSFTMLADGSVNRTLWEDFATRAVHEQMVKTKALTVAYYGSPARYTYFTGGSTGGRQGLMLAQRYPEDADGIISAYPAINWSKFITAQLYPQLPIHRDLGGKYMSLAQLDMVTNAAIAACDVVGGKHLGFILDNDQCHYDPTKDREVLCTASGGNNATPLCVTPIQALAFNKIWYGMTADGSVPDPAVDNGSGPLTGVRRWYGLPRGTKLHEIAYMPPFRIAADMVAIEMKDPRIATEIFKNAVSDGLNNFKSLSYAQLSEAFDAGVAAQADYGYINTDDPDLTAFKVRGGKLIQYHGTNDQQIPFQGSPDYYDRVVNRMGGLEKVQSFFRFYVMPGMAHGPVNGTPNPAANPPTPGIASGRMQKAITDWVEKGIAPDGIVLQSNDDGPTKKTMPLCTYPQKITYVQGDPFVASSYVCR